MTTRQFIYFVNLDDFLVSHNLGFTEKLSCPSISHFISYNEEHPLYNIEPDNLLSEIGEMQTFLTPRLTYVYISHLHNKGLKVGVGLTNTIYYPEIEIERIINIANLEIEFEKIRKKINPNLPSRLMCIYLAEDDLDGRIMLNNMFHKRRNFLIVPVKIEFVLRFHKADSKWVEVYEKTKEKKAIENYWNGKTYDKNPQYEYLLDGGIELLNLTDKEKIFNDYKLRHI